MTLKNCINRFDQGCMIPIKDVYILCFNSIKNATNTRKIHFAKTNLNNSKNNNLKYEMDIFFYSLSI